ncbi:MAG TPA: NUDIX domain-containing protein [Bacteroidales bacterium]
MSDQISSFNIRVYGLFIHAGSILITDEFRMGQYLTKFPGGGMHFGEGTIECLQRECMEEIGQEIKIQRHFYTTDFFQATFFLPQTEQLLSIYYLAELLNPALLNVATKPFDFDKVKEGAQRFRWIPLPQLTEDELTLPVDKVVAGLLKRNQENS